MLKGAPGGLADVWRKPIAEMFDNDELDEGDVVTESSDREGAKIVWTAALESAATKIESTTGTKPTALAIGRALAAVLTPTSSVTGVTLKPTSSGAAAGADAGAYTDFGAAKSGTSAKDAHAGGHAPYPLAGGNGGHGRAGCVTPRSAL